MNVPSLLGRVDARRPDPPNRHFFYYDRLQVWEEPDGGQDEWSWNLWFVYDINFQDLTLCEPTHVWWW